MSETSKPTGIDLQLDEATAQGHYANLAIISHSPTEFVLDFAAVMPGVSKPRIKSRIVLGPEHAKRLLLSLQENVTRYESAVGRIDLHGPHSTPPQSEEAATLGFLPGEA